MGWLSLFNAACPSGEMSVAGVRDFVDSFDIPRDDLALFSALLSARSRAEAKAQKSASSTM